MEHRWGHRRNVLLGVQLYGPSELSAIGWLTNISLSGAYVKTMAALDTMSQIHLEVHERCGGKAGTAPLLLQGRVVRHGPAGVGIEWEEFASGTLGGTQCLGLWTAANSVVTNESLSVIEP